MLLAMTVESTELSSGRDFADLGFRGSLHPYFMGVF
jgi:hypothetical protein